MYILPAFDQRNYTIPLFCSLFLISTHSIIIPSSYKMPRNNGEMEVNSFNEIDFHALAGRRACPADPGQLDHRPAEPQPDRPSMIGRIVSRTSAASVRPGSVLRTASTGTVASGMLASTDHWRDPPQTDRQKDRLQKMKPTKPTAEPTRRRAPRPAPDPAARQPDIRVGVLFIMPPIDLFRDRMLYPLDKVIAGILCDYAGSAYLCWPTNRRIAEDAGCSVKTVYECLKRLSDVGWITIEPAPSRTIRGQIIRLNWRRAEGAEGAGTPVPGGRNRSTGGGRHRNADRTRPIQPDPKPEEPSRPRNPSEDILDAASLAWWTGVAAGGDRAQAQIARAILRFHERAVTAEEAMKKVASPHVGVGLATEGQTIPDATDCSTEPARATRPENETEHNRD